MRNFIFLLFNLFILQLFTGCTMQSFDREDYQKITQISRDLVCEEKIPLNNYERRFIKQKNINFAFHCGANGKIWWNFNDTEKQSLYFDITSGNFNNSLTWHSINYVIYHEKKYGITYGDFFEDKAIIDPTQTKMMTKIAREKLSKKQTSINKKELAIIMKKEPKIKGIKDDLTMLVWELDKNRGLYAVIKKMKFQKFKAEFKCVQLKYKVKIFCKYEKFPKNPVSHKK